MPLMAGSRTPDRLDQNLSSQTATQRYPGPAHTTNQSAIVSNLLDLRKLTKTHLAQSVAHSRLAPQCPNTQTAANPGLAKID